MSWTTPPYFSSRPFPQPGNSDSLSINEAVKNAINFSNTYKVPVFMGEFGVSTSALSQSRCNYVDSISINARTYSMPWYYWDVITNTDAFGFVSNNGTAPITCFASSLKLGTQNICSKVVSSTNDIGIGTLWESLSCVNDGDTISFAPNISGDTIFLKDKPVFINKNVVLKNNNNSRVYITTKTNDALFSVAINKNVVFENLELLGVVNQSILNNGQVTLKNSDVNMPINKFFLNKGKVNIEGVVKIK
jgi:hypothetical protein